MTWEQISLDMHYTNRWLRKMHERALDVVDRILLESERVSVSYLGSTAGRRDDPSVGKRQHVYYPPCHICGKPTFRKATCGTENTPAGHARRRRLRFEKPQEDRIVPLSSSEFRLMHT